MRNFYFAVGSLAVAIGAVLLATAALTYVLIGRELSSAEKLIAGTVAVVIALVWWAAMQRKLRHRGEA